MDDINIYTCYVCGKEIGEEEAHIWEIWPSDREERAKGNIKKIALCPDCETEAHRTGEIKLHEEDKP